MSLRGFGDAVDNNAASARHNILLRMFNMNPGRLGVNSHGKNMNGRIALQVTVQREIMDGNRELCLAFFCSCLLNIQSEGFLYFSGPGL